MPPHDDSYDAQTPQQFSPGGETTPPSPKTDPNGLPSTEPKNERKGIASFSEDERLEYVTRHLTQYVEKIRPGLGRFFGKEKQEIEKKVEPHARRAAKMLPELLKKGCTNEENMMDFVLISLYDVVMLLGRPFFYLEVMVHWCLQNR